MRSSSVIGTTLRGYGAVSPAERASFEIVSAFGATIAISRAINYARERSRPAPGLRSLSRRARQIPSGGGLRVHHFVPGVGLAFAAGGGAILTRTEGRELWLSLPFGVGAGLTLDEIALLVELDNPYWQSQAVALVQAAVAAAAAAALAVHFHRRGASSLQDR